MLESTNHRPLSPQLHPAYGLAPNQQTQLLRNTQKHCLRGLCTSPADSFLSFTSSRINQITDIKRTITATGQLLVHINTRPHLIILPQSNISKRITLITPATNLRSIISKHIIYSLIATVSCFAMQCTSHHPMGRKSNDSTTVICSSITLLQERFRQLQRMKEMREEKQLLQMIAEAEKQPRWFFHPDLIQPTKPLHGSSFQLDCMRLEPYKTSISIGLRPNDPVVHTAIYSSETDVDTSLHL